MRRPAARVNRVRQYAMGWMVGPYYDFIDNAIRHDGEGARFHSFALVVPEKQLGVVWLINIDYPPTETVFSSLGWGIAEICLGRTPPHPQTNEPVLLQYARAIGATFVVLLGLGVLWSLRCLRRWRRQRGPTSSRGRGLAYVIAAAAIDAVLALYVLAVYLPQNNVTLPVAPYFAPDVGALLVGILALTLGWGAVRTVWMLRVLSATSAGRLIDEG